MPCPRSVVSESEYSESPENFQANTQTLGETPFHHACYFGMIHNVKILLKNSKKHNINIYSKANDGMDGQDIAEQEGHTKIVKLIKTWKH